MQTVSEPLARGGHDRCLATTDYTFREELLGAGETTHLQLAPL